MKETVGLTLFATLLVTGCAPGAPISAPDFGFSSKAPQGWTTVRSGGGNVLIQNREGSEFVLLHPFKPATTRSAEALIGSAVKSLDKQFPDAKISRLQAVGEDGNSAIAKVLFTNHGAPGEANVLCYETGAGAMLYAIAAPASRFREHRRELVDVLSSCKYAPSAVESSADRAVTYRSWTDPREGAFSVQIPRGWEVVGGAFRFAPVDIRKQYAVASPDGAVRVQYGDARLTAFAAYGPSARMRGLRQLQQYVVNGVTYTVLDPMNGATFAQKYASMFYGKKLAGFKVTGEKDRPDIAAYVRKIANGAGISCGEADFEFDQNGVRMEGAVTATVFTLGNGSVWGCIPMTVTAPPARMTQAWDVWKHLGLPKDNPQWSQQQQENARRFNQMVAANHEATMAQLARQYKQASDELDNNSRQWDNIINGVTDLKDASGKTYQAKAGRNYYFGGANGVVGNNTGDTPDASFGALKEF